MDFGLLINIRVQSRSRRSMICPKLPPFIKILFYVNNDQ